MFCESTGVDAVDAGNLFLFKPLCQRARGLPMRMVVGIVLGDNRTGMYAVAFKILAHTVEASAGGTP